MGITATTANNLQAFYDGVNCTSTNPLTQQYLSEAAMQIIGHPPISITVEEHIDPPSTPSSRFSTPTPFENDTDSEFEDCLELQEPKPIAIKQNKSKCQTAMTLAKVAAVSAWFAATASFMGCSNSRYTDSQTCEALLPISKLTLKPVNLLSDSATTLVNSSAEKAYSLLTQYFMRPTDYSIGNIEFEPKLITSIPSTATEVYLYPTIATKLSNHLLYLSQQVVTLGVQFLNSSAIQSSSNFSNGSLTAQPYELLPPSNSYTFTETASILLKQAAEFFSLNASQLPQTVDLSNFMDFTLPTCPTQSLSSEYISQAIQTVTKLPVQLLELGINQVVNPVQTTPYPLATIQTTQPSCVAQYTTAVDVWSMPNGTSPIQNEQCSWNQNYSWTHLLESPVVGIALSVIALSLLEYFLFFSKKSK